MTARTHATDQLTGRQVEAEKPLRLDPLGVALLRLQ
ncbi:hypothetical protein [Streptomyces sp. 351MFTsu5.1]|nr:hypothetical protein [Streptomyces sp. 351MFTsu5.1]